MMQTFLPYKSFTETAKCLDYKRLGKQRVEAKQVIDILEGNNKSKAWTNHPAVLMWKGYEECLKLYYNVVLTEWIKRDYNNTMKFMPMSVHINPWWLGNDDFHASHRASLLHKDYEWYSQFGWKEKPELDYVWPSKLKNI